MEEEFIERERGEIRFYDGGRGWGFIERQGYQPDLFLHKSALRDPAAVPVRGSFVSFVVKTDHRGLYAAQVEVCDRL